MRVTIYSQEALTDKLFTGQRLDDTGLYYYGARYYDPLIGRFISADTIIPDPFNPQAFNRYSYCLNNPLKYVDPSGHAGTEDLPPPGKDGDLGWSSEDGWVTAVNGRWVSVSGRAVDTMVSSYREYRESTAGTWSEFVSEVLPVESRGYSSGELSSYVLAPQTVTLGGQNYMWGIQQYKYHREKDIGRNASHPQEPLWTLVELYEYDWTTQNTIALCDAVALAGDAASIIFPPSTPITYTVSAVSGSISYGLTVNEYRHGRMTEDDMFKAHISWSTGLIPLWGAIPAGRQFIWDVFSK